MAFRIRDLMIQVVAAKGGGNTDPECTCGPASRIDPDMAPTPTPPCTCGPETRPAQVNATPCTCGPATRIEPMAATPCTCGPESMLLTKPAMDMHTACTCGVATMGGSPEDPIPGMTPVITTVTTVTTVTTLVQGGGGRPKDLKALKEELRRLLEELERRERRQDAPEPAGMPQTVEEAEDLERRLQGAIKELRDHKETLKKPEETPAPKPSKARKGRK